MNLKFALPCKLDRGFEPERVLVPSSDYRSSYLLEVFEMGRGPIGTGARHAVWLHHLQEGGFRWACYCGVGTTCSTLDTELITEARAHFD